LPPTRKGDRTRDDHREDRPDDGGAVRGGTEAVGVKQQSLVGPHAPEHGRSTDSRLSESDRADSTNHRERPSKGEILKTPLTERDGVTLREDVRDFGALQGTRPLTWRESVHEFRDYIRDTEDTDAIFKNTETGEYHAGGDPHRFAPEYADKQYAKLKDLQRGLESDYGKRLHTAMLTFTGSAWPDGDPLGPVDHLDDLLESWEAIRRELARRLDGRRWERLAILEPHESGYIHVHMAVFVDGKITREDFAPVIEAHLRNCPIAGEDAHDIEDDDTISIRHAGTDRDLDDEDQLDELAIYLAEYLGTYGDDPLDAPEHVQQSNAVLWATGRQRWRPSNGAQRYMRAYPEEDPDEPSPWELEGIVSGEDYYPATDTSGGVDRFVTSSLDPPDLDAPAD
jgi:hypothetical protein